MQKEFRMPENLIGERFGQLIVVSFDSYRQIGKKQRISWWLCKCVCGNSKIVSLQNLKRGHTKSCGCYKPYKKSFGYSSETSLIGHYTRQAKKRNYVFNLTRDQAHNLFIQNCFYCGVKPKQIHNPRTRNNGAFIYNGIDRLDNTKGYYIENCVACCGRCNRAKDTHNEESYYNWIKQSYEHLKSQGKIE